MIYCYDKQSMKKDISLLMHNKVISLLGKSKKIFIAYSGGVDSHVLLHLLAQIRKSHPKLELTAIHVNHNLSSDAKKWVKHCQNSCKKLRIQCVVTSVDANVKIKDHSPEEIARNLRYAALVQQLPKNALLVTAHHVNDQAETLLLQLFRGAGPKGLAAMPVKIKFAKGWLLRPLLDFSREDILQYARKHKLKWIEDESNTNPKYARNFIRYQLLPIISKQWPGVVTALNRAAKHCAVTSGLLSVLAAEDLKLVEGKVEQTIDLTALKKLSVERQENLLRFWLHGLGFTIPSEAKLREVLRTVVNSRSDTKPLVKWSGVELRRFQNHLYAMSPLLPYDTKAILSFDFKKPLKLPADLGVLRAKINKSSKGNAKTQNFTVRFRQGGEKLKLSGRQGTHKLKKLMQEWQIPFWLRDRIPLVYCGEEIIAVVGYYSISDVSFR